MGINLFLLGILLSFLIRLFFIFNGSEVADIHSLKEMGELTLRGVNPYLAIQYNIYPPLALYLEAFSVFLSQQLNIPFYILSKFWPNLADFAIAFILYKLLVKKDFKKSTVYLWVLLFLLNPISILISSAHGQIDSIPTLFTIFSLFILSFYINKYSIFLSALSLGLAIAIKPSPLILLPAFLILSKTNFRQKAIFLLLTIIPTLVFIFPYFDDYPSYVLQKVFSYSGSKDFGIPALLKGLYYLQSKDYNLEFSNEILNISKVVFLFGSLLLLIIFRKSKDIVKGCLAIYLLFLTTYFGISAQYLSWILPLAILKRDLMIIPFSIAGFISLLGFYFFINPQILLSQASQIPLYQAPFMLIYVLGNVFLWTITLWWLIKLSKT